MKICHIISMPNMNQMGLITQEIYNRCDGNHIWIHIDGYIPVAEIYILHYFKNNYKRMDNFILPINSKKINLIHSSFPCLPHTDSDINISITESQQKELKKLGYESQLIRGAIDLTEFLKIKINYDYPVIGKISRAQKGKNHELYNYILYDMIENYKARAKIIMNDYKKLEWLPHHKCKYVEGIEINNHVEKALELSELNIYADAHSIDNLFIETFNVSMLESMACGLACCIIGYKQPAMREVLSYGGLISDNIKEFSCNLKLLCESKQMRIDYGERARRRAQEFKLDIMIAEWNDLFRRLLN